MGILQSEGIDTLIRAVAREAAGHAVVEDAARYAASLGGRFTARLGLLALTRVEEHLLATAAVAGARMGPPADGAEHLVLTGTGRLRLLRAGEPLPAEDAHVVGGVHWPDNRPDGLDAVLDQHTAADRQEARQIANWLAGLPREQVAAMVQRVRHTLLHMAPVVLYTGARVYTNLGKRSNLVGKSLRPESPRCVLTRLDAAPVAEWDVEDACFLGCMHALLSSGPPVRAEEFSGTQLRPDRLATFLRELITLYGGPVPQTIDLAVGVELQVLAQACAEARAAALARGARPYRLIEGLNLNKKERLEQDPITLCDLPEAVLDELAAQLDCPRPADYAALRVACDRAVPGLHRPGPAGFGTRFEQALHDIVRVATEATDSEVGMSRGPRRFADLIRLLRTGDPAPLAWTTRDFFCCVTPSARFVARFVAAPAELPRAVRAISARMRYNGWHYLPHTLGMADRAAERDWYFAPTMPDLTDWSDQHHTGHVANGVRYAIRVPFGVELAGAQRPGLHDFRLMRTGGTPYTESDLRAAIAVGEALRCLYQAHVAALELGPAVDEVAGEVTGFDNPWYEARYAAESVAR